MPDAKPAPIHYARATLRVHTWLKRVLILAWLAITVYLLYDKWHLRVRLQLAMLDAQRAAARYMEPPDRVIFESAAQRVVAMEARGDYRSVNGGGFFRTVPSSPVASIAVEAPRNSYLTAMANFEWWDQRNTPPAPARPGVRRPFGGHDGNWGIPTDEFPIFLHERRTPAGKPRLLFVTAYLYEDGSVRFVADVKSVAGPFSRPSPLAITLAPRLEGNASALSPTGGPLRLFAPQPDPADASRFTFVYENGVERGTVEGRLNRDDYVEFTLLPGATPLTQPAAPVQRERVGNYDPADAEDHNPAADP